MDCFHRNIDLLYQDAARAVCSVMWRVGGGPWRQPAGFLWSGRQVSSALSTDQLLVICSGMFHLRTGQAWQMPEDYNSNHEQLNSLNRTNLQILILILSRIIILTPTLKKLTESAVTRSGSIVDREYIPHRSCPTSPVTNFWKVDGSQLLRNIAIHSCWRRTFVKEIN